MAAMTTPHDEEAFEQQLDAELEAVWGENGTARTGTTEPSSALGSRPRSRPSGAFDETLSEKRPMSRETRNIDAANTSNPDTVVASADSIGPIDDKRVSKSASRRSSARRNTLSGKSIESKEDHNKPASRINFDDIATDEPTTYLENNVFPILLPGIEKLLKTVKRKDGQLEEIANPLTWLAQYLAKNNPNPTCTRSAAFVEFLERQEVDPSSRQSRSGGFTLIINI